MSTAKDIQFEPLDILPGSVSKVCIALTRKLARYPKYSEVYPYFKGGNTVRLKYLYRLWISEAYTRR